LPKDRIYTLREITDDWQATDKATLLFVVQHERVLLIRKKRGLGAGKINGPGGKLEPGESNLQCALRELKEELHITARNPVDHGRLRFQFQDGYSIDVRVFIATEFDGKPIETEEAIPHWYSFSNIPFDEMWADDRIWLPKVLSGEKVDGRFLFAADELQDHDICFTPS